MQRTPSNRRSPGPRPGVVRSALSALAPALVPALVPVLLPVLLGVTFGVSACRSDASRAARPPTRVPFATQVAYGRPDTCPEDAVDPYGDGTPSPMDLRCSYADGTGGVLTRVRGRVSLEGLPGALGASPGRVEVVMYQAPRAFEGSLGPRVAHATTDPQGTFSLGVMLRPGTYVLVVPDAAGGRPRVQQRVTVGGDAGHRLDDVQMVIPKEPDESP